MTDALNEKQREAILGNGPRRTTRHRRTKWLPPWFIWHRAKPPTSPGRRLHVNGGMAMI